MLSILCISATHAHDFLLEAKGAYFLADSRTFRNIYDDGGGIYGAELTGKVCNNWYLFASADFLGKSGCTVGFNTPTHINIATIGLGIKYMLCARFADLYIGVGVLPTHVRTFDGSPYVPFEDSKWGCGGIAKIGTYITLPCNWLLDIFFDYSFVKISFDRCSDVSNVCTKADVSGCWFGIGLGYRFN